MYTNLKGLAVIDNDFKVADISLADFGRKEIRLAENEMPGLMALRAELSDDKPFAVAKVVIYILKKKKLLIWF